MVGKEPHHDFNEVQRLLKQWLKVQGLKATAKQLKLLWAAFTERDENAQPVVQGTRRTASVVQGMRKAILSDQIEHAVVQGTRKTILSDQDLKRVPRTAPGVYKPDPKLRDTENVPLTEAIEAYFAREVLPHVPDAWIDDSKTVRGYEISFTKYFYQYQPLRSLDEIVADIQALEAETEGLLEKIVQ